MEIQFDKILTKIEIAPREIYRKDTRLGQFIFRGFWRDREVVVKILSKSYHAKLPSFTKEILVNDVLLEGTKNLKFPRVLSNGEDHDFAWLIREFIAGESLADTDHIHDLLFGSDQIRPEYQTRLPEILNQFDDQFCALRGCDRAKLEIADWPARYKFDLRDYCLFDIEKGLDASLAQTYRFYSDNLPKYRAEASLVASHGDLLPANILIADEGVTLSDFEWFGFDNRLFDIAFLWLFLWRYPSGQRILLTNSVKNSEDRLFFQMSVIRIITAWYRHAFDEKREKTALILKRREEYKHHIWKDYLVLAGESFDALIKEGVK